MWLSFEGGDVERIKRSNWPRKQAAYARIRGWRWCWCWWGTSTLENEHMWLVLKGSDGGGVEKEKSPSKTKVGSSFLRVLSNSPAVSCMRQRLSRSPKRAVRFQRSWARFEGLFWASISSPNSRETVENSPSYTTDFIHCELHEVSFSEASGSFSAILGSFWRSILSVNFEHKIEGNGGELTELCYSQQRGPKSWVLPWSQLALMGVEYVAGVVVVVGGCHGRIHFCGDGHNSPSPRHQLIVVACCPPWTRSWWCDRVQTLTMSLLMSKIQWKSMWFLGDSLLKY